MCPRDKPLDLATFHQNRAAAYDQMEETDKVIIKYSIKEQTRRYLSLFRC